MPLTPELDAFLELAAFAPPMCEMTPAEARAAYDAASIAIDLSGSEVDVTAMAVRCRSGHVVPARLYCAHAAASPAPVLLFFHGGGYVLGGLDSHDSLCRDIAYHAGAAVLAIDYRRAPEHRFPAAFEDAEDAHLWLLSHASECGLDAQRIAVGGDSVGGTLATALCIAARDARRPQPGIQLLLYPCVSSWQDSPSHERLARGHLLERSTLQWMFGQALRGDADRRDWRFAPAVAESLAGLAPAHVVLAEYDPLVDEGRAYTDRLLAAGVPVTVDLALGMVHDFARLGAIVPEVDDARRALGRVLAAAWR